MAVVLAARYHLAIMHRLAIALVFSGGLLAACTKDAPKTASGTSGSSAAREPTAPTRSGAVPDLRTTPRPAVAAALPPEANPPGAPTLTGKLETDRGVQYIDEQVGTGAAPVSGKKVSVHYTGWLTDGTTFDSSRDRGEPIQFTFDGGQVIKGWDIGLTSMKVGGRRRLIIPADLAYGDSDRGPIPPGSTLVFDVELMEVGD